MGDTTVDYSIVIPVYYNEGSLKSTMESILEEVCAKNPDKSCEVIFVDDGSGDGSLEELLDIQKRHPRRVRVIKFTRNFGQPLARLAGLRLARGKCAVTISADGQDPTSLIHEMLKAHFDEGFEIVICERAGRDESWVRRQTSRLFYGLMRKLSFPAMPLGGFDYVLVGRQALDAVLRNQEAHPFFQGQVLWTGFKHKSLEYRRRVRKTGESRWSFGMKIKLLIDGVMNYSFLPIRLISVTGILMAVLGASFAVVLVMRKLLGEAQLAGWTATMTVLLVTSGVQMLMLGVIGEYLWRVLAQVQNREPYIIDSIYDESGVPAPAETPGPHPDENAGPLV
jgi:dolichol-phosphate mannosyltransferase